MTSPLLEVRDAVARIGNADVLHTVSLEVMPGQAVCLLGPNGAGKTTLLRAISGLVGVRTGNLRFDGRDLASVRPWKRVGLGIAHVPQDRHCFGPLTVTENLRVGAYSSPHTQDIRIGEVMNLFPALSEKRDARAAELSGGQQQMLAIGRALMSSPRLLLLDEPTLGLAPNFVLVLKEMLVQMAAKRQIAMLLVEQNSALALEVCEAAYVLQGGRVVISGRSCESLSDSDLAEAYLGGRLSG